MLLKEENELLTRTGPGTPMGELFRRFWLPVALSREVPEPDCPPVRLRILSEDLVAFRDTNGQAGLIAANCPHRGASLFFGRNEEYGTSVRLPRLEVRRHRPMRGHALRARREQLQEQDQATRLSRPRGRAECSGPTWDRPSSGRPLPELEWTLVPESHVYVHKRFQHCNYLQNVEGEVDSAHVSFLHREFLPENFEETIAGQVLLARAVDRAPTFLIQDTDYGLVVGARRHWDDRTHYYWRLTQFLMPSFTLDPRRGRLAHQLHGGGAGGRRDSWWASPSAGSRIVR